MPDAHGWCEDVNKCIENNMGIAHDAVEKYKAAARGQGLDSQDLLQAASIGLWKAWESFRPELGFQFSTYASKCVENEIKRSLGSHRIAEEIKHAEERLRQRLGREPDDQELAVEAGVSIEDVKRYRERGPSGISERIHDIPDRREVRPDVTHEQRLLEEIIKAAGLTADEEKVMRLRWGMDQAMMPRPRALVAALLAGAGAGSDQAAVGVPPPSGGAPSRYSTDRVRALELSASGKIERTVKKREH